ncbi:hypothetical protein DFS34DRAFT_598498 [Phlyctochytrium arcticum]|nr:hypothetical protein DFS34DRAFT_598498 [Phlyctochytrium arcticum]
MPLFTTTPPKVVVTGGSGLLGRQVVRVLKEAGYDVVGTAFSRATGDLKKVDLTKMDEVRRFIEEEKPRVILHCAAERRPEVAQSNKEVVRDLNVKATEELAAIAKANNAWFVYISTDYVFDGTKPPYEPEDKVNPLNFYGETKFDGEEAVRRTYPEAAILRVPILYGEAEKNSESAVNILLDVIKVCDVMSEYDTSRRLSGVILPKDKKPVEMDAFQVRYPTNVADVAKVLKQMVDKVALENKHLSGTYHFSSDVKMSKYSICGACFCLPIETFAKLTNLPIDHLKPLREAPKEPTATRPHDAQLATTRLKKEGIDVSCVDFESWWKQYLQQK